MSSSDNELVMLDTDIGSDIDDALALAYLLRNSRCDLLGITTVSGEPHLRAKIASAICREAGRPNIPIHVGAANPVFGPNRQPNAPHAGALGDGGGADYAEQVTAIDFLRNEIRSRPGRITLLAIGPLTNIALLFAAEPEIPTLLKLLVLMGGQHTRWAPNRKVVAEWNLYCDPQAAAMVFAAPVEILAIGYDVTTLCSMKADNCGERLAKPGMPKSIIPMADIWLQHASEVVFHDPLAAAVIFDPTLCTYERGLIEVETTSPRAAGMTYWSQDEHGRHVAASSVNSAAFFKHYFDVIES